MRQVASHQVPSAVIEFLSGRKSAVSKPSLYAYAKQAYLGSLAKSEGYESYAQRQKAKRAETKEFYRALMAGELDNK
jgi:hypothetical protein